MRLPDLVSRHPVSLGLATAWSISALSLSQLPGSTVERVLHLGSTTLPRLAAWPVALPVSGLLVRDDLALWLLTLAFGTAVVEAHVGWRSALLLISTVHVGATALSQALLGIRVALGEASEQLLHQLDVGPSYLAIAGLAGAAILARSNRLRLLPLAALAVGLPELIDGLPAYDLAATGHLAAAVLGLTGGLLLRRRTAR